MSTHHMYYLRMHRKRSHLTQSDLAFLLGLPEQTNISHWEKGRRIPNLEVLMFYHLLFGVTIESLFQGQKEELTGVVKKRIALLLKELSVLEFTPKVGGRMEFLDTALKRLAAEKL